MTIAVRREKFIFVTMLILDLYELGLIKVREDSKNLLLTSWHDQPEVGVHLPIKQFNNDFLSWSTNLWYERQWLRKIAYGEISPPASVKGIYNPPAVKLLEYLGIMTRACGRAPEDCPDAEGLLYGICEIMQRLIESNCKLLRVKGSELWVGDAPVPVDKSVLRRSIMLIDESQRSRYFNAFLNPPLKKSEKPRKLT